MFSLMVNKVFFEHKYLRVFHTNQDFFEIIYHYFLIYEFQLLLLCPVKFILYCSVKSELERLSCTHVTFFGFVINGMFVPFP